MRPIILRGKQGGETPPLRQRIGAGATDKGDMGGAPTGTGNCQGRGGHLGPPLREGVEGEHKVRPYGFTGWKPVLTKFTPSPALPPLRGRGLKSPLTPLCQRGGFFHPQPGPQFSKDGALPDYENARGSSKGQDQAQAGAGLARRGAEILHSAQI